MAISLVGPRLVIHLLVAISNATYQLSKYTSTSIRHSVWFSGHNAIRAPLHLVLLTSIVVPGYLYRRCGVEFLNGDVGSSPTTGQPFSLFFGFSSK